MMSEQVLSIVILTSLTLGALVVLSTIFVFVRNRKLDVFGMGFCLVGLLLISVSFWKSVNIKVAGAELKLEQAQILVARVEPLVQQTQPVIDRVAFDAYRNFRQSPDARGMSNEEAMDYYIKALNQPPDDVLRKKMEEWTTSAPPEHQQPTIVSAAEVQILVEQWKTITDMTSSLSKDINDMAMTSVRNLR